MTPRYAYSLTGDPQDYHGSFTSRRDARAAALDALKSLPTPPTTVYVGRAFPADPQTTGHARAVVRDMSRRGEVFGLDNYLSGLKVDQLADLDKELSATIANWLLKHHLEPKSFHIEAISEYPVPTSPQVKSTTADEVHDIGESRSLTDL